jgi:hypothetical protein
MWVRSYTNVLGQHLGRIILHFVIICWNIWLTLNLLTTTIVAPPSNASKWQMGFNP